MEGEASGPARPLHVRSDVSAPQFGFLMHEVNAHRYYSYKFQCREKGIGWRLDTFIVRTPILLPCIMNSFVGPQVSDRLYPRVSQCEIRQECYGASDHVPVVMDLQGALED